MLARARTKIVIGDRHRTRLRSAGPDCVRVVQARAHRGANYRTMKVPSDVEVTLFVKDDLANFYKATFDRAVTLANMRDVFVEYAWNMNLCDPCSADAMTESELLQELGVPLSGRPTGGDASVDFTNAGDTYVTRLHLRYDAKSLPEDLNFIETGDRENFQARYILQHPYVGKTSSADGAASLPVRLNKKRKASPM